MNDLVGHPPRLLGQMLIETGLITHDQLRIALREQAHRPLALGKLLVELGFATEATVRDALSRARGARSVDLVHAIADPEALALVSMEFAHRHRLVPLRWDADRRRLVIAMADVDDLVALDRLRARLPEGAEIECLLAGEGEIARASDHFYGFDLSLDGILTEIETGEVDPRTPSGEEYRQPVVRLVDALLTDAVKHEASDIHFEPEAGFLRVRYRIDGLLRQIRVLHKSYWPAMVVRIKVMAGLNIAETRAPQDGRISLNVCGRAVDFRVSSQPTLHGENLVLRILDRQKGFIPMSKLGLSEAQLTQLQRMIARPEGIILFCGPTGSGKTTTLYSILSHINDERINIMTLEDPVEYPMTMVRQTSVSEASKLDFVNGIRSMMRQDPDVILVGEIRDAATAEMAFRAAMTGHQVYATLHSNSAIGVIPRLLDIGVLPDILAGHLIGMVAQRLLRRLCPHCRQPYRPGPTECRALGVSADPPPTLHRPAGCARCHDTGYRGRLAIMELIRMDAELDELIARRATHLRLYEAARVKGFTSLAEDGIRHVLMGHTALEELARVVDLSEHMLGFWFDEAQ